MTSTKFEVLNSKQIKNKKSEISDSLELSISDLEFDTESALEARK